MSADETRVDPTEREPYDVLQEFDYYAAMGATIHLSFKDIPDKSFHLDTQVTHDQVETRTGDVIVVEFNLDGARCDFFPAPDYGIYWKTDSVVGSEQALDSRVILEVLHR